MKKQFSIHWKSSKQKRKKVKYKENSPLHLRKKFLSANLAKELRKKHKKRSISLRKGDLVKVMRGEFYGKEGKIESVDLKKMRASIEGIKKQKKDGSKINIHFNASNLQIKNLNLDDKEREKILLKKNEIKENKTSK